MNPPQPNPSNRWIRWQGIAAAAVVLAVFAAYAPALRGGFLWDDDAHVTRPELQPLGGLRRIWTQPGATQQYYPVLHSAFWVEHRLWGDSPLGYHLVNIALHLMSAGILYRILRKLGVPGALLGAALFALHPVCVESIAWISEQKNALSSVFCLGAALAYLRFDADRRPGSYAWATGLFVLALLSKTVTAVLPGGLLVILWWKRGSLRWRSDALPLVPWFLASGAAGAVTTWMERTYIGARGTAFSLGFAERVLIAGRAVWFYLGKLLWPANLVFIYPRWTLDPHALWQYLFPAAALGALGLLWALRRRTRGPLAAALLFAGTLFPAIGFINVYPFVFSFVADHFQYLAAASMIPALAAGLALATRKVPAAGRTGAALVLAGGLAFLSWRQSGRYGGIETFYRSILDRNPGAWLAHDNLGVVLVRQGKFSEAASHYREAMRLNPSYPEAFNNYGNVLAQERRFDEAAQAYAGALRARSWFAAAQYNWGNAMNDAGRFEEAAAHFEAALKLQAAYPEASYGLANALANGGHLEAAVPRYLQALALRPDYPEAHANLGLALAELGRGEEALVQVREAVRLRPRYAEAHAYYGFALAGLGRLEEALEEYRLSLETGPDNPDIHYQMGVALEKLGRNAEAQGEFARAHSPR